jgi:molecular chaperone HscB
MPENQIPLLKDAREGHSLCWSCKQEIGGEPLCPSCVKIQPLGRNSDYFSVMGLPRKLTLDPRVLEPVFHALSRRFHPDMYRMASGRERVIALENSAVLNQAYRTLRDPFDRATYLLHLETGKQSGAAGAPPQDLFEEILEIQELLGEFRFAESETERAALRPQLQQRRDQLQEEQDQLAARLTGGLFSAWDHLQTQHASAEKKTPLLEEMRRILDARSYLRKMLESLGESLPPGPSPSAMESGD